MKAIILAAGKGSRLQPHTDAIPKPLLPIRKDGDITILDHLLQTLPLQIDEVIIIVKYLKEKVISHINQKNFPNLKIQFAEQGEIGGTMGALIAAKSLLDVDHNESFLIVNGDDIHKKEELEQIANEPLACGLQKKIMPGYRTIEIDSENFVTGLRAQTPEESANGCLCATGVYKIDTRIFDFEKVAAPNGEIGLPDTLLAQAKTYPLKATIETGWTSVNTIQDLENLWSN